MRDLERRLRDLEAAAQPESVAAWCFADLGETDADAIARRWPQGRPLGASLTIIRWAAPDDAQEQYERSPA